jgi:isocitrate/isopropylmalate dehydrogenase
MSKAYQIAVLPGDGIGPEVMAEGLKVLDIAAKKFFLEGQKVAKIDQDVMWFHQDSIKVNPRWPHKVATKIGNHVFYTRQK